MAGLIDCVGRATYSERLMRRLRLSVSLGSALAVSLAFGCATDGDAGTDTGSVPGDDEAGDDESTGADESGGGEQGDTAGDGMDGGDDMPGESGEEEAGDDSTFIANPDGGGVNNECDIWTQDCPEGEKCMPWANDGGGSWNATRCSPLDPNPGQPGDTCTVEGSGVSGIDDCDISNMCWNVDPETNQGTCVPFCEGDEANPLCSDPDNGCSISNDGTLILCLPFCDPLLQDCTEGEACYPEAGGFICSPDASGPDLGAYGDPCEFLNVCDPGFWCADAASVPGCAGSAGCCSAFCDFSEAMADQSCPGFDQGQSCVTFWVEGEAPPGEEDYGLCLIEQ